MLENTLGWASRLHAGGVRRVTLQVRGDTAAYTSALTAAGITMGEDRARGPTTSPVPARSIVAPASDRAEGVASATLSTLSASQQEAATATSAPPPPAPQPASHRPRQGFDVVEVDRAKGTAILRSQDITVVTDLPRNGTVLHVLLRCQGKKAEDTLDLSQEAARQRLAGQAARTLPIEPRQATTLLDRLLPVLEGLMSDDTDEARPVLTAPDAAVADTLLAHEDVLARFQADLDSAGWFGDEQAKSLVLLALVGRHLADPPWIVLRGDPVLTGPAMTLVSGLLTDTPHYVLTRSTEAVLGHGGQQVLRQRVLFCDDAAQLRPETVNRLRVLQDRGAMLVKEPVRDGATGRLSTRTGEARGPVGLIAAAACPTALDALAIVVPLDASPAHTQRALMAARARRARRVDPVGDILHRWRLAMASLVPGEVDIPFAERVGFPAAHPRHRRDQDRCFALMEAHALLHQRRRLRLEGRIQAREEDFRGAERACRGLLGLHEDGLSPRSRQVLRLLADERLTAVTLPLLHRHLSHLNRSALRSAVEELVDLGFLHADASGRGLPARTYAVRQDAIPTSGGPTITLQPVGGNGYIGTGGSGEVVDFSRAGGA